MNIVILGRHGFIGSALYKKLSESYDIANYPNKDTVAIFHFASPTHIEFEENLEYHGREIIENYLNLLPFCKKHDIYFVHASSALVYEKSKPFSQVKHILERLPYLYGVRSLALRIFPVYGTGEKNKRDKTVIYKWCKEMKQGIQPVVYGDGLQTRDFIYIDDAVDAIIEAFEDKVEGIIDIGAGKPISFNEIISIIRKQLGRNISPKYIKQPAFYSEGISTSDPVKTKIDMESGIRKILRSV